MGLSTYLDVFFNLDSAHIGYISLNKISKRKPDKPQGISANTAFLRWKRNRISMRPEVYSVVRGSLFKLGAG